MNDIQTVTKNVRLQKWTDIIRDCRSSGQTVDDYCAANHISRNAYYYWLRKVKEAVIEQSGPVFAEINPAFVGNSNREVSDASITLCINDATICVTGETPEPLLRMVIEAVRYAK